MLLALPLSGCKKVGPVDLNWELSSDVTLTAGHGLKLDLRQGSKVFTEVTYYPRSKKIELYLVDREETVTFKKGILSDDGQTVRAEFQNSGQKNFDGSRLGLEFRRSLICDPDCQQVTRRELTRPCTYYITRPYTRCEYDLFGYYRCTTYFERIPRPGWERVELTTKVRRYDISGTLFSENAPSLASAAGMATEEDSQTRQLELCR